MRAVVPDVWREVDRRTDEIVSFLRRLVQERSTLGNERSAQEVVHAKLLSLGLESTLWEPSIETLRDHPSFAPVEWSYQGRPNVTALMKSPGGRGRSLVLNGHIDVVSPEPTSMWTQDPWAGAVVDGRMYGRGTADMKSGIAMIVAAVEALKAAGVVLGGDLLVESVIEEECTGNGTLASRLAGSTVDGAIVCEPYALAANVATVGVTWFRVAVRGRGAHVLEADEAVNAIEKCFPLIAALRRLEESMNRDVTDPLYRDQVHPINLNVGTINGGDWPSTVPSLCEFECRISSVPGVSPAEMRQRIEATIAEAADADPWLRTARPTATFFGFRAAGSESNVRSDLVQLLGACHRDVLGEDIKLEVSKATNDVRYFVNDFGIPAIAYGPRGGNLHGPDEYVELDSISKGAKVLAHLIMEWCGIEQ